MAGRKERQRKLARERLLRQQARRAQRARRRRVGGIAALCCCAAILVAVGGFFAFRSGKKQGASALPAKPTGTPGGTPAATSSASAAAVAEPASHCVYTRNPPAARNVGLPPATPTTKATYQATIATNRGVVVMDLHGAKATCTVNSFVYLAGKKYFDNTPCHRLTTSGIYVLQCGDPTGSGSGGPGYKFASENLAGARYAQGTVAMANLGPGTNGSQFFIVYKNSLSLPAQYTPFGTVVKGLGIIQDVAKAGTDNANGPGDGHPKDRVVIDSVTITKA